MILENGKFTEAVYASGRKDLITALWRYDGADEFIEVNIETDLENEMYIALLDTFTVDQISNMTNDKHKREIAAFEAMMKDVGEKFGLLYNADALAEHNGKKEVHSIDHIFEPPEGTEGEDLLFNLKLRVFDMDEVNDSKRTKVKKQLREAKTPLEVLYLAGKFLYE